MAGGCSNPIMRLIWASKARRGCGFSRAGRQPGALASSPSPSAPPPACCCWNPVRFVPGSFLGLVRAAPELKPALWCCWWWWRGAGVQLCVLQGWDGGGIKWHGSQQAGVIQLRQGESGLYKRQAVYGIRKSGDAHFREEAAYDTNTWIQPCIKEASKRGVSNHEGGQHVGQAKHGFRKAASMGCLVVKAGRVRDEHAASELGWGYA
eukprot:1161934-Pelagomonas_calceolata.AAC.9